MPHLTIGEQKLLSEIFLKGSITKKTQKTFESKKFYDAMGILIKNNLAKVEKDGNPTARYSLTLNGEVVALILRSFKR